MYVPTLFANSCFIARYIPTLSDHCAFFAVFTSAGLGLRLEPHRRSANFYWKFNSSLLSEPAFMPAFTDFLRPVEAAKDRLVGAGGQAGRSVILPLLLQNCGHQKRPNSAFLYAGA
jgi:hypothetical protein